MASLSKNNPKRWHAYRCFVNTYVPNVHHPILWSTPFC